MVTSSLNYNWNWLPILGNHSKSWLHQRLYSVLSSSIAFGAAVIVIDLFISSSNKFYLRNRGNRFSTLVLLYFLSADLHLKKWLAIFFSGGGFRFGSWINQNPHVRIHICGSWSGASFFMFCFFFLCCNFFCTQSLQSELNFKCGIQCEKQEWVLDRFQLKRPDRFQRCLLMKSRLKWRGTSTECNRRIRLLNCTRSNTTVSCKRHDDPWHSFR